MTASSSWAVCEVAAERLLDDDPGPARAGFAGRVVAIEGAGARQSGVAQLADDDLELARRRGEVEHAVAARARAVELLQHGGQAPVPVGVVELPLHVARRLEEAVARGAIDDLRPVVIVDRRAHQVAELLVAELLAAVADQRRAERQHAVTAEVVESRDQLAVGEVPCDPEHDEAAGIRVTLAAERRGGPGGLATPGYVDPAVLREVVGFVVAEAPADGPIVHRHSFSLTAWPPNSLRSAASTLPLNVSSWRERKRMNSAEVITGMGTRVGDRLVHRPAAFAGVLHVAGDVLEPRVLLRARRRPARAASAHHAALVPEVGDRGEVEVAIGRLEELEALGVGLHHAVLDAVVDHLRRSGRSRGRRSTA